MAKGTVAARLLRGLRAARLPATLAAAAGLVLPSWMPIDAWWLPLAAAAGALLLALVLFAVGGRASAPADPWPDDTAAFLERSNGWQQVGHAFATAGFILAALGAGLASAMLAR